MTKKDYVAIAAVFTELLDEGHPARVEDGVKMTANRMSDMLARDNPRFDRNRFLAACAAKVKE